MERHKPKSTSFLIQPKLNNLNRSQVIMIRDYPLNKFWIGRISPHHKAGRSKNALFFLKY